MPYLSQILGLQVVDASGEKLGVVSDLGAAVRERFPRITALAFKGPAKVPFMISWRKYVASYDDDVVVLNVNASDVRFSYLQPDELLLRRDLLNKQIVDTQGMKVVRVNDLKLSATGDGELRLLGAEVGVRGILRGIAGGLETATCAVAKAMGKPIPERVIAWSYMDLLDHGLSQVRLSVTHKSLDSMHPADIADIIEQLDPKLRAQVFSQLDNESAAEALSELDEEVQADVIDELPEREASAMIAQMDPDDAADIIGQLDYAKAEKLLELMGVKEEKAIRQLLGYPKDTAGGIMTSEFISMPGISTVADARKRIVAAGDDLEHIYYVYVTDADRKLSGVVSLRTLLASEDAQTLDQIAYTDLITVGPETDEVDVVDELNKYSLVDVPVVNEEGLLLGIVTFDDAIDVLEQSHERELALANGTRDSAGGESGSRLMWFLRREIWFVVWVVASALLLHVAPVGMALMMVAMLPAVLLVADDMIAFASSYLFDEEDRPSLIGLVVRNLFIGIAVGVIGWLVVSSALRTGGLPDLLDIQTATAVLSAAMATIIACITASSVCTQIIEKLISEDKPMPGSGASLAIMVGAVVVFVLLTLLVASIMGVL